MGDANRAEWKRESTVVEGDASHRPNELEREKRGAEREPQIQQATLHPRVCLRRTHTRERASSVEARLDSPSWSMIKLWDIAPLLALWSTPTSFGARYQSRKGRTESKRNRSHQEEVVNEKR